MFWSGREGLRLAHRPQRGKHPAGSGGKPGRRRRQL